MFESRQKQEIALFSKSSTPFWSPPILSFCEYQVSFPRVKRPSLAVDHFHLVPRQRMDGAVPYNQATNSAYSFSFLTQPAVNTNCTVELNYPAPCVRHTHFRRVSFFNNSYTTHNKVLSYHVYVSSNNFKCSTADSEASNKRHISFVTE